MTFPTEWKNKRHVPNNQPVKQSIDSINPEVINPVS